VTTAHRFSVDTDLGRIDLDTVHRWLSTDSYWAIGRSRETVQRAAEGSLNFGAFDADGALCGYARVVTDRATFAWLCDVYVDRARRGEGVGHLLARSVVDTIAPMQLLRVMLATHDAHELYEHVGFVPVPHPEHLMLLERDAARGA
jgi:GNAT superfamily N-acetyltransferase